MKILIAPTSFKGSLTPVEAADAIASGIRAGFPNAELVTLPLADGGEGTLQVLTDTLNGERRQATVDDPLGRPVDAEFGLIDDGRIAVVESAQAIGLTRLPEVERDPFRASSHGVGQLIRAALDTDARTLWIGLGGSATVDGGLGMLQSLGARCLDSDGRPVSRGGRGLDELSSIDLAPLDERLAKIELIALCDVQSPLLGDRGARLYMAQKGASSEQAEVFESGLRRLANVAERVANCRIDTVSGSGAAGGLGAALALLDARLVSGSHFVMDALDAEAAVASADLVITGEGRLDVQTSAGKPVAALAARAQAHGCPILALCGSWSGSQSLVADLGLTACFSIVPEPMPNAQALRQADDHLHNTARGLGALIDALE